MPGHLAALVNQPSDLARVTKTFQFLVMASLESHPVRHLTRAEIKRRFGILHRWYEVLRADKGYSLSRTLDTIVYGLKADLDGATWEPPVAARLYVSG